MTTENETKAAGVPSDSAQSPCSATVEGWILIYEGELQYDETMGLGKINGVQFQTCCDLLENDLIKDAIEDTDFKAEKRDGVVEFVITNLKWDKGQMSFPETGQWDFPPHWEFDIEITKTEYSK